MQAKALNPAYLRVRLSQRAHAFAAPPLRHRPQALLAMPRFAAVRPPRIFELGFLRADLERVPYFRGLLLRWPIICRMAGFAKTDYQRVSELTLEFLKTQDVPALLRAVNQSSFLTFLQYFQPATIHTRQFQLLLFSYIEFHLGGPDLHKKSFEEVSKVNNKLADAWFKKKKYKGLDIGHYRSFFDQDFESLLLSLVQLRAADEYLAKIYSTTLRPTERGLIPLSDCAPVQELPPDKADPATWPTMKRNTLRFLNNGAVIFAARALAQQRPEKLRSDMQALVTGLQRVLKDIFTLPPPN